MSFGSAAYERARAETTLPRRVPGFMHELQVVAIKVGDIGRVVTGSEVSPVGRLALVDSAGADCGRVGCVNCFVALAHDAEVQARLAERALAQPDARSHSGAGDVCGVAEAVKVRDTGGASGRVVVPDFAPA